MPPLRSNSQIWARLRPSFFAICNRALFVSLPTRNPMRSSLVGMISADSKACRSLPQSIYLDTNLGRGYHCSTLFTIPRLKDRRMKRSVTAGKDVRLAKRLWGELSRPAITTLKQMIETHSFSLPVGDLVYLGGSWYVTHTGLLGLARRNRCSGIHVRPVPAFCDPTTSRWTFEATVYKS